MRAKIMFEHFIFLTLMVDDKEVELEEAIIQKRDEGSSRLQNHNTSICRTTSPQWTSKTNTFNGNSINTNIFNKEQYLELQRNEANVNHSTVQELTGGKIANYNRSSGMIENLSIDPYHCNLSSNQEDTNRLNSASTRQQDFQGIRIYFLFILYIYRVKQNCAEILYVTFL